MLSQQAAANHLESSPAGVAQQLAIARMQTLSDAEFAALMRQAQPAFLKKFSQDYSAHLSDYDEVRIAVFIWKRRKRSVRF